MQIWVLCLYKCMFILFFVGKRLMMIFIFNLQYMNLKISWRMIFFFFIYLFSHLQFIPQGRWRTLNVQSNGGHHLHDIARSTLYLSPRRRGGAPVVQTSRRADFYRFRPDATPNRKNRESYEHSARSGAVISGIVLPASDMTKTRSWYIYKLHNYTHYLVK